KRATRRVAPTAAAGESVVSPDSAPSRRSRAAKTPPTVEAQPVTPSGPPADASRVRRAGTSQTATTTDASRALPKPRARAPTQSETPPAAMPPIAKSPAPLTDGGIKPAPPTAVGPAPATGASASPSAAGTLVRDTTPTTLMRVATNAAPAV